MINFGQTQPFDLLTDVIGFRRKLIGAKRYN